MKWTVVAGSNTVAVFLAKGNGCGLVVRPLDFSIEFRIGTGELTKPIIIGAETLQISKLFDIVSHFRFVDKAEGFKVEVGRVFPSHQFQFLVEIRNRFLPASQGKEENAVTPQCFRKIRLDRKGSLLAILSFFPPV